MDELLKFVADGYLILAPVLYVLGMIMKKTEKVSDKYIPLVLLVFGILLACLLGGFSAVSVIQGILVTGLAVLANQVVKQVNKVE